MNFSKLRFTAVALFLSLFLSACSPHPATGVWKSTGDNQYGIDRLVVGFEGRAEFITKKLNNAVWHCFWSASDKKEQLNLDCSASIDPKLKKKFELSVNDQSFSELKENGEVLAIFARLDEDPSPREK